MLQESSIISATARDPTISALTKRNALSTDPQSVNTRSLAMPAIPKGSLSYESSTSGVSIGTQTIGTDTSFDSLDFSLDASTSTPPRSRGPSPSPKLRQTFEFTTRDMPPDHPPIDLSKLPHWSHLRPEHAYEKKNFRCPCPAIATLVNHNYLTPKVKEERIPWYKMVAALRDCFNLDLRNALFLTFMATILCGNWWAVSLKDLQRHNKVEHDASITRHDFNTGKCFREADNTRVKEFMDMCKDDKKVTLDDYALRRCQVESQLWLEGTRLYRWFKHSWIAFLGRGEVALTMRVFGEEDGKSDDGISVRKDWLEEWFKHERLPADWKRPEKPFNMTDTFKLGFALNRRMNAIRDDDEQLDWCACPRSSCI